jgi:two-component system, NtrC family, sensor histidine kinase KinB
MALSLRHRIVLTLVPVFGLLLFLGGSAAVLIHRLSGRIDLILRENYDSVVYMERLKEALERIDSSYTFALAGQEQKAKEQYQEQWPPFVENLRLEQNNITLPGERELVERLNRLTEQYRQRGDAFYARPAGDRERDRDYFGSNGLLESFKQVKDVADEIRHINQENMEAASRDARRTARESLIGFALGMAATAVLAAWLAWYNVRAILRPVQSLTQSAVAIGAGNLDQVVAVTSRDELGQLAQAFNTMARHLRHYRQTDYSRLLRAQRTSQATIDSFPDPVLVVDMEGHVEMANPAAQQVLGITGKRTDAQPGVLWQPPEALREPIREAMQNLHPYVPEELGRAILLRVDGQERIFLPRVFPISDPYGNTLGAALLLSDVTRFRLLDQVKSDLIATVSHELKTPLTSIRLDHHLLLEEAAGPLTQKQVELLLDARDNSERLLSMVNNLLDLARIEAGSQYLELKPESPALLLKTAAEAIRPRADDKDVNVELKIEPNLPPIDVDAQRLGHALGNLLDNALNHTGRGGRISLSAGAAGGEVTIAVADTGSGIPPEYLPHVFDRFFRIPGQSKVSGTGLGLAIVREIVTAHGGTINCESRPGEGTVFNIRLPARRPMEARTNDE